MTIVLVDALVAAREAQATGVALLPPAVPGVPGRDGAATFSHPTGLLVTGMVPDRPAARSGLQEVRTDRGWAFSALLMR